MTRPSETHLLDNETMDAIALDIAGRLHAVPVGQAKAILRAAGAFIDTHTVFDSQRDSFKAACAELEALIDGSNESP